MSCYVIKLKDCDTGIIHGKLGKHCTDCGDVGKNLCDYSLGKDKTCDRSICDRHSHEMDQNLHYCGVHFRMWEEFKDSDGVTQRL